MDVTKAKNMELSKFFFLGMIPLNKRIELISKYIENCEIQLKNLKSIKRMSEKEKKEHILHNSFRIANDYMIKQNLRKIS